MFSRRSYRGHRHTPVSYTHLDVYKRQSHPFYTGKSTLVDTAGRVDKFMSRYGDRKKK